MTRALVLDLHDVSPQWVEREILGTERDGRVRVAGRAGGWLLMPAHLVRPIPRHRADDSDTAVRAGEGVQGAAAGDRLLVLRILRDHADGLTDFELAAAAPGERQQTSLGKRRVELQRVGLVRPVEGVKRPAPSGALAQVWAITLAGRSVLASTRLEQAVMFG